MEAAMAAETLLVPCSAASTKLHNYPPFYLTYRGSESGGRSDQGGEEDEAMRRRQKPRERTLMACLVYDSPMCRYNLSKYFFAF